VVRFSRSLVCGLPRRGRLPRVAAVFHFVGCLIDCPAAMGESEDGVNGLLGLVGHDRGPAVILTALLLALGERAELECTREMAFVRCEVARDELSRVPPHARVFPRGGRYYTPLDPRRYRSPLGFLPMPVRDALARRAHAS